jgi:serine/threonine protein kinase
VLTQIGEALAVLHDGGLVHGDLTTSNLMVRSRDTALVRAAHLRCLLWWLMSSRASMAEHCCVDE